MPRFFALVDAVPGREKVVEDELRRVAGLAVEPCKEKSHDFLVAFEAPAFDRVDDFLQTHVRRLPGVQNVEVVTDWDDHGATAREARDRLA